jgi:hypothetical protein
MLTVDYSRLQEARDMAPQHGATRWALAQIEGDKVYQLCIATSCKDYITDAVVWCEEGPPEDFPSNFKFYGDYDQENTTLIVKGSHYEHNRHLLNKWEEEFGLKTSVWLPTDDEDRQVLVADKFWQTTTIHLSLFLSMTRNINTQTLLSSLVDEEGADYYVKGDVADSCLRLPGVLKQLVIGRKRNAPNKDSYMHSCNGHYCMLTNTALRRQLFYTDQLYKIDPTIFIFKRSN